MSKKEEFIGYIENLMKLQPEVPMPEGAKIYWEAFRCEEETEKPLFTCNGKLILEFLKEHVEDMPSLKAKDIGEHLLISSRAVTGAIRKLVTDGYVEKVGKDPVFYSLTEKGKNLNLD
jgi:DNA-binding MarR family transcriptional regulator